MTKIAVVYNTKNEKAQGLAEKICAHIVAKGGTLLGGRGIMLRDLNHYDYGDCDFVVELGGDGTMLAVARQLASYRVPLLAVNMGRVGFLSNVEPDGVIPALDRLFAGDYLVQERLMLHAVLLREEKVVTEYTAFNEVAVSGINSRAVTLDVFLDREHINSYNADGVIVATPTGSTGYSLSAGGPIVMETLDTMLLTPVCPHTFFSRPIVASAASEVEIINRSPSHAAMLTADGQSQFMLEKEDVIHICQAPHKARIIHFTEDSYFERIKRKLYI